MTVRLVLIWLVPLVLGPCGGTADPLVSLAAGFPCVSLCLNLLHLSIFLLVVFFGAKGRVWGEGRVNCVCFWNCPFYWWKQQYRQSYVHLPVSSPLELTAEVYGGLPVVKKQTPLHFFSCSLQVFIHGTLFSASPGPASGWLPGCPLIHSLYLLSSHTFFVYLVSGSYLIQDDFETTSDAKFGRIWNGMRPTRYLETPSYLSAINT